MLEFNFLGWSLCDKLYKASLFSAGNIWDESINYGEDLLANWILFHRANKIFYNLMEYYYYSTRPNSITTKKFSLNNFGMLKASAIIAKDAVEENKKYKEIVIRLLYRNYLCHLSEADAFFEWEDEFEKYRKILKEYNWVIKDYQPLEEKRCFEIIQMPYKDMLQEIEILVKELKDFVHAAKNIYIYGAGVYGKIVKDALNEVGIKPTGFIITKGDKREYCDLPVYLISEFQNVDMSDSAIVLGLSSKYTDEVKSTLAEFDVVRYYDAGCFVYLYKIWLHSRNKVSVK